jgi:hypothetical protein
MRRQQRRCAGGLLVERHEFQGSRLFLPRAFSIGGAAWRVLSGGKNQPLPCRFGTAEYSSKNRLHRNAHLIFYALRFA